MTEALKKRLIGIKSEVKELHPLLQTVFTKMPTLNKVEYTHGPNEKGADFILTKISEELGDTEHIGVIVKQGKIVQNISSIQEQIQECTLRRLTGNGKKEIYLSEIWVVVNGTISANAKEKIFDQYKTQKIKFIDINVLYKLTLEYCPDYGVDIDIHSLNYLNLQRAASAKRISSTSLLSLAKDSYIDQDIVKVSKDFTSGDDKVDIFEQIKKKNVLFIEAPMGGGKSSLIDKVIDRYTELESYKDVKILPIFLDKKELLESDSSLDELVQSVLEANKLDSKAINSYLIIIDGLDEVKEDVAVDRILLIAEQAQISTNKKLIVTSRAFTDEKLEATLESKWDRYRIQPLTINKIIKFIEIICSSLNLKKRLIEDLKQSELFKVLPKTPISAIILAKLLTEGSSDLPTNITELYSKYCELSLGRWDIDKGIKTQKQYEALDRVISLLACYMIDNSIPAISLNEALDIFKKYLHERNLQLDYKELFNDVIDRSDILSYDESQKTVMFKHRSFAEFFYAKHLLSRTEVIIESKVFHPYWSNIYFFYIGLKKDCPELLQAVIALPVEHEGHKLSKLINMGDFLLAGYQSPYNVISSAILQIFKEYGKYFDDVSAGRTPSVFSQLPTMHLLALFRHLLAENYSYDFFGPAIQLGIEEIATSPELEESRYALLFLDMARCELGYEQPFEKLLEESDNLPTPIQLAIAGCARSGEYNSALIKKLEKRIKKRSRASLPLRQHISDLYNKSIDGSIERNMKGQRQISRKK